MKPVNHQPATSNSFWSPNAILLFILLTIFVVALSLDVFIVSLDALSKEFQVSQLRISLVMGLWSAGVCLGQLIFGPLMDALGRKKVFLAGMLLTAVTSFPCIYITNFDLILLLRFCHGFGVAAQILASRAVLIDIFASQKQQAKAFAWNTFFTLIGAFLAPLFAAYMITNFGWKSLFLVLGSATSLISLLIIAGFPETLPVEKRHQLALVTQLKGYFTVLSDRVFLGYTAIGCLAMFWIFAHFAGAAYLYISVFAMTTEQFSLYLAVNMLFGIGASLLIRYLLHSKTVDCLLKLGEALFVLHVCVFLGLALVGLTSPLLYIACVYLGNISITFLMTNSMAAAISYEQKRAGTAAAIYGSLQFAAGFVASAVMGLIIDQFIAAGYPTSTLPMPLLFFVIGIFIIISRFTLLRKK